MQRETKQYAAVTEVQLAIRAASVETVEMSANSSFLYSVAILSISEFPFKK